jgi:universal stress protein E
LRKAAQIAAACGARVTLFHAFSAPFPMPKPMPSDPAEILRVVTGQRREKLLELARPLRASGLKVKCEVVWDLHAAHAIVRHVLASSPDLVVAESHRRSRLARWFLAYADWELIRECPCPVWFVKHERFAKKPLVLTAVDPTHAHAKPSRLDDRLLQATASVIRQLGGRAALIHVEDPSQIVARLPEGAGGSPSVPAVTMEALDRLAKRNGIDEAIMLLRSGIPADVLTVSAAEIEADLLVMGAVARSGLSRFRVGNTAEAVIEAVTCDVLVVKPRQFKTGVSPKGPRLLAASR